MKDLYGREIEYMRISITDRCNLRCTYCMPHGIECISMSELLTFEEISEICGVASELGIKNIRLTGGEPLVRRGCSNLVKMIKSIDGIERVSMTTNGILLTENLDDLTSAGLDGLNISLDTIDDIKYKNITGSFGVEKVLSAIDVAYKRGLNLKINTVLLEENIDEAEDLILFAKDRNISVRFIELMPIGEGAKIKGLDNKIIMDMLKKKYPKIERCNDLLGCGPAVYYKIPEYVGKIGFINAIHDKFCDSCNRIRLTSTGYLKSCLCYDKGTDLKEILRSSSRTALREKIIDTIYNKPREHCFNKPDKITEVKEMYKIGG